MENKELLTRNRTTESFDLTGLTIDNLIIRINEDVVYLIKTWGVKREDIRLENHYDSSSVYLVVETPETPQEIEERVREDNEYTGYSVKTAIKTLKDAGYNTDSIKLKQD